MPATGLAAIATLLVIYLRKNHEAILPIEIFGLQGCGLVIFIRFFHNKKPRR
jgi:hypothetical protein